MPKIDRETLNALCLKGHPAGMQRIVLINNAREYPMPFTDAFEDSLRTLGEQLVKRHHGDTSFVDGAKEGVRFEIKKILPEMSMAFRAQLADGLINAYESGFAEKLTIPLPGIGRGVA